MPMRRDQPFFHDAPSAMLRTDTVPRLRSIFSRAVRVAFASSVIAAGCSDSHANDPVNPNGGAGRGAPAPSGKGDPATCERGRWKPVADLEPAEPVDYTALLTAYSSGGQVMERGSAGTACQVASGADCEFALLSAKVSAGFSYSQSCGMIGPCSHFVVTTAGETVTRYASREALLEFLGPLSNAQEVLLLLDFDGYTVTCEGMGFTGIPAGAPISKVLAKGDHFEATVLKLTDLCPISYDVVVARVSVSGEVTVLSSEKLAGVSGCAGRRPEGWVASAMPASDLRIAEHFALMAQLEAASVTAFEVLAAELVHHAAPAELIERTRAAAREEIEHARATAELAHALGGAPLAANVEPRPLRGLEAIAVDNVVEGCVRETFGAAVGCYQAEAAAESRVAALMRALARDETRHAALAFDIHTWIMPLLDAPAQARVHAARDAAVKSLASELQVEPHESLRVWAGMPSANDAATLYEVLREALWTAAA